MPGCLRPLDDWKDWAQDNNSYKYHFEILEHLERSQKKVRKNRCLGVTFMFLPKALCNYAYVASTNWTNMVYGWAWHKYELIFLTGKISSYSYSYFYFSLGKAKIMETTIIISKSWAPRNHEDHCPALSALIPGVIWAPSPHPPTFFSFLSSLL